MNPINTEFNVIECPWVHFQDQNELFYFQNKTEKSVLTMKMTPWTFFIFENVFFGFIMGLESG